MAAGLDRELSDFPPIFLRVRRSQIEGIGKNFGNRLVFMSATEDQHHQRVGNAHRGPIGATLIQARAGDVEHAIRQARSGEEVQNLLQALEVALAELMAALQAQLDAPYRP